MNADLKYDYRDNDDVYLRMDVKLEPLVDGWQAWPHLLSPLTQALNLAYRYIPIARSFVAAPAVHAAAALDPAMLGGPFLNLPEAAVPLMARWISDTERRRADALNFVSSLKAFDTELQSATGQSLDSLRIGAPDNLRGLIELSYDLRNRPRYRIIESILAENDLGLRRAQSVFLCQETDAERPFFLSRPRIMDSDGLNIACPFDSDTARLLYASRWQSISLRDLASACRCEPAALQRYFTPISPPPPAKPYDGNGVRIRYFGHACILIESPRCSILTDPTFALDQVGGHDHLRLNDLPERIDILLLSHGHQDHFHPETLLQIRDRVSTVLVPANNEGELADPSPKRMLQSLGYKNITELRSLDEYQLPAGRLVSLPFSGEHCDLDIGSKQCALIEVDGKRICLLVDSDAIDIDVYMKILDKLRDIDVLFIGMECFGAPLSWLYGPLLMDLVTKKMDASRRMSGANAERARRLTQAIRPGQVHVYAMGQEPWMRPLMGLQYTADSVQMTESSEYVAWCRAQNIMASRLHMLWETII